MLEKPGSRRLVALELCVILSFAVFILAAVAVCSSHVSAGARPKGRVWVLPDQEPSSASTASGVAQRESDTSAPRVVSVTPAPNGTPNAAPGELIVTFSEPVKESTINASTIRVVRAGGDGGFSEGNEVHLTPAAVTLIDPVTARVDLTGLKLPDDRYRVLILGGNTTGLASSSSSSSSSTGTASNSSTASTSNTSSTSATSTSTSATGSTSNSTTSTASGASGGGTFGP
ncbi:MAG: Ig-like domain-containing protein [Planctomycetota bacterium]|nr:Ig-like domain-containing protein [Planctomycetota bacterium]